MMLYVSYSIIIILLIIITLLLLKGTKEKYDRTHLINESILVESFVDSLISNNEDMILVEKLKIIKSKIIRMRSKL